MLLARGDAVRARLTRFLSVALLQRWYTMPFIHPPQVDDLRGAVLAVSPDTRAGRIGFKARRLCAAEPGCSGPPRAAA